MTLEYIMKRYRNAKQRARFWSGNPSFCPSARSIETSTSRLYEKYELAMCDCHSWETEIERITGKRPKHYDPKQEFRNRWNKLMTKTKTPKPVK